MKVRKICQFLISRNYFAIVSNKTHGSENLFHVKSKQTVELIKNLVGCETDDTNVKWYMFDHGSHVKFFTPKLFNFSETKGNGSIVT